MCYHFIRDSENNIIYVANVLRSRKHTDNLIREEKLCGFTEIAAILTIRSRQRRLFPTQRVTRADEHVARYALLLLR